MADANVNLATEVARVDGDARVTRDAAAAAIRKAGYDVRAEGPKVEEGAELRREFISILIGAVLTLPLVAPMVGALFDRHLMLPAWWQIALATPVQFWLGARSTRRLEGDARRHRQHGPAGRARHQRRLRPERLPAAGAGEACASATSKSAAVITLVLLGKWLKARAKRQTAACV